MKYLLFLAKVCLVFFPWPARRLLLNTLWGYEISRGAYIGFSFVYPDRLCMASGAKIGHLNYISGHSLVALGERSSIGNLNWITGLPVRTQGRHFSGEDGRVSALAIGAHAAITNRHYIDCTNGVAIGEFSILGGVRSIVLTHEIDIVANKQISKPVSIGRGSFVGAGVTLVAGACIPDYTVIAAGAVVTRGELVMYSVYGGVPARKIAEIAPAAEFFTRSIGYVE